MFNLTTPWSVPSWGDRGWTYDQGISLFFALAASSVQEVGEALQSHPEKQAVAADVDIDDVELVARQDQPHVVDDFDLAVLDVQDLLVQQIVPQQNFLGRQIPHVALGILECSAMISRGLNDRTFCNRDQQGGFAERATDLEMGDFGHLPLIHRDDVLQLADLPAPR